jgi:hypothetical protein
MLVKNAEMLVAHVHVPANHVQSYDQHLHNYHERQCDHESAKDQQAAEMEACNAVLEHGVFVDTLAAESQRTS